jgi:hypothetical protein
MAAYDNVQLPGAPNIAGAGNYAQMLMQGLTDVGKSYQQGKQFQYEQRQRDMFQNPDNQAKLDDAIKTGNYTPLIDALTQAGGASTAEKLLPFIRLQPFYDQALKNAKKPPGPWWKDNDEGGAAAASSPNTGPANITGSSASGRHPPPMSSAGMDNRGGETVQSLTAGIAQGMGIGDVPPQVMQRYAAAIGQRLGRTNFDLSTTLEPNEEGIARQIIGNSLDSQRRAAAAQAQPQAGPSQAPVPPQVSAAPGFNPQGNPGAPPPVQGAAMPQPHPAAAPAQVPPTQTLRDGRRIFFGRDESLESLAAKFRVPVDALARINPGARPGETYTGEHTWIIPTSRGPARIQSGLRPGEADMPGTGAYRGQNIRSGIEYDPGFMERGQRAGAERGAFMSSPGFDPQSPGVGRASSAQWPQAAPAAAAPAASETFNDRFGAASQPTLPQHQVQAPAQLQSTSVDPAAGLVPPGFRGDSRIYAERALQRAAHLRQELDTGKIIGFEYKGKEDEANNLTAQAKAIKEAWAKWGEPSAQPSLQSRLESAKEAGKGLGQRHAEVIKSGGAAAHETLDTLGIMEDAVRRSGGDMTTGPHAETALHFKQAVNNIIPGFFSPGAIVDAEAITKLNSRLASAAAKGLTQRPSQLEFRTFVANNPGISNSPQGSLFLIEVLRRQQEQNIRLGEEATNSTPEGWPARERAYHADPQNHMFSEAERRDWRIVAAPTGPPGVDHTREGLAAWARQMGVRRGEPIRLPGGRVVAAP